MKMGDRRARRVPRYARGPCLPVPTRHSWSVRANGTLCTRPLFRTPEVDLLWDRPESRVWGVAWRRGVCVRNRVGTSQLGK